MKGEKDAFEKITISNTYGRIGLNASFAWREH